MKLWKDVIFSTYALLGKRLYIYQIKRNKDVYPSFSINVNPKWDNQIIEKYFDFSTIVNASKRDRILHTKGHIQQIGLNIKCVD